MRSFILRWLSFLPVLGIAVAPSWFGMHFRSFMPFLGFIAAFAIAAVLWLRFAPQDEGDSSDD